MFDCFCCAPTNGLCTAGVVKDKGQVFQTSCDKVVITNNEINDIIGDMQ